MIRSAIEFVVVADGSCTVCRNAADIVFGCSGCWSNGNTSTCTDAARETRTGPVTVGQIASGLEIGCRRIIVSYIFGVFGITDDGTIMWVFIEIVTYCK